jgi:hypothetical protein
MTAACPGTSRLPARSVGLCYALRRPPAGRPVRSASVRAVEPNPSRATKSAEREMRQVRRERCRPRYELVDDVWIDDHIEHRTSLAVAPVAAPTMVRAGYVLVRAGYALCRA